MRYLYAWFLLTCILPWSPWFGDKPEPKKVEPEPVIEKVGYLCDCGWRNLKKWDAVEVSPFTWRIQEQPF